VLAGLAPGATLPGRRWPNITAFRKLSPEAPQGADCAELLVSVPGPRGGYRLARTPERITFRRGTGDRRHPTRVSMRRDPPRGPLALDAAPIDGLRHQRRVLRAKARGARSWNAPRSPTS
jgi:hypothetical protein